MSAEQDITLDRADLSDLDLVLGRIARGETDGKDAAYVKEQLLAAEAKGYHTALDDVNFILSKHFPRKQP